MRWTDIDAADYYRRHPDLDPRRPQETRRGIDAAMAEDALLSSIRRHATATGWLVYHTHDSRKSEPGFPDTVLTNGTSLLLYELKTATGKITAEQARWLALLAHTGKVECGIWRPGDLSAIRTRLERT